MKVPVNLHCRIWMEKDGDAALGKGIAELLARIRDLGSLKKAAESMHMPYRGAWGRVRRAEAALGIPLLASQDERQKGLSLTPQAIELLDAFQSLQNACLAGLAASSAEFPCLDVHIVDDAR